MVFSSWDIVLKVIIFTLCAYVALVVVLRTTGQRTLSQLNAFDFIVTVAIGSILASTVLFNNVTLVDGLTAIVSLIGMQFVITWLTVKSEFVKKIVKNEPKLLYYEDNYLIANMEKARISKEELEQSVRSTGYSNSNEIGAVVLETNGMISVISKGSVEKIGISDVKKLKDSLK